MSPERESLARRRMERARETLAAAERLREVGAHLDAANRYYYATFHAARALLAAGDLRSAGHKGVIVQFQSHFVRAG